MKESRDLSITIRKSKQSEKCQDCQFTSQLIQIPRDDLTDFIHSQKHVSASNLSMITYNGLTFEYAALLSHLESCCCTPILSHSLNFSYYIHRSILPGTAGGTVRRRAVTVAMAISSLLYLVGQECPAVTMLGFSSVPSRYTWWSDRALYTAART